MTRYVTTHEEQVAAGERRSAMMTPLVAGLPWQQAGKIRELVAALLAEGRVTMTEMTELGAIWDRYPPEEVMGYEERIWYLMLCLTADDVAGSADCEMSWAKLEAAHPGIAVVGRKALVKWAAMAESAVVTG